MLRISVVFVFVCVLGTALSFGGHEKGFLGLGKEADAILCKADNLKDDKLDMMREEMKACHFGDECAALADDLPALKSENSMIARPCSEKYKKCCEERHKGKEGGEGGHKPTEEEKKAWMEKWKATKECLKTAFEKVFGEKL